jgi:hypothetical protein
VPHRHAPRAIATAPARPRGRERRGEAGLLQAADVVPLQPRGVALLESVRTELRAVAPVFGLA